MVEILDRNRAQSTELKAFAMSIETKQTFVDESQIAGHSTDAFIRENRSVFPQWFCRRPYPNREEYKWDCNPVGGKGFYLL
ncbi:hypothetical protein CEXT_702811 [Caerostris extrusa]|uniref:Uncharacterized protein n=1 Tax=Caerostris extrusa TaxID=172846 RepID=A0AAV4N7X6_CAEEX|nr:hypothetical protein CEXT_702811 [Caerostris extrusa]